MSEMRGFCRKVARSYLKKTGISADATSEGKLEKAVGAAYQRASCELARMSQGYDQENDVPFLSDIADRDFLEKRLVTNTQTLPESQQP